MGHFISSNAWFRRSNALLAGHLHSQKAMHFSSKPIDKGKGWSYLFFSCWINLRLRPLLNLYSTPEIWRGFQVNWCHTTSQDQHYSIWECLMETSMWRLSFLSSYQQVLIIFCVPRTVGGDLEDTNDVVIAFGPLSGHLLTLILV